MAKYFVEKEFQRCTPACHLSDMDPAFLDTLDRVRELAGIPLVLNSAFRTKAWELQHGRTGTSSHCKGLAVDIRCGSDASRYRILSAALRLGVCRIGVGRTYIHLDTDGTKSQNVVWHYYD